VTDLFPHCLAPAVGAIDDLDAMGHRHTGSVALERVGARHVQGASGHLHPRTRDDPLVDRLPEVNVGVSGSFRLDVADRGETLFQRPSRIHRGQDGPVFRRLLQQLRVVIGPGDVSLQEDVRVRVDQPGEAGATREVDDLGSLGHGRGHADDLSFRHDEDDILAQRVGVAVEQAAASQRDRLLRYLPRHQGDKGGQNDKDQDRLAHQRLPPAC
jgi:hypothetical protein